MPNLVITLLSSHLASILVFHYLAAKQPVIGVASCYAWGRGGRGGGGGGGLRNHTHNTYISNVPQLPADRPCVWDRQRDDASWFNY